jgi:hypothetical protein
MKQLKLVHQCRNENLDIFEPSAKPVTNIPADMNISALVRCLETVGVIIKVFSFKLPRFEILDCFILLKKK